MRWGAAWSGAAAVAALTAACGGGPPESAPPSGAGPAPWFADEAASRGITLAHRSGHEGSTYRLPEIMGGGAALLRHGRRRRPRRAAGAERRRSARPTAAPGIGSTATTAAAALRTSRTAAGVDVAGLRHGCGHRRLRWRRRSRSCISPISAATSCSGTTDWGASPTSLRRRGSPDPAGARARRSSTSTPTAGSTSSSPGISPGRPSASVSASA